ncbi:hypothetical protein ULG90_18740 [Halopseudomonas pachastrellae]|nr:hypothetical protein ULG90_18740 [Halopseudomonas pachastrellae]
MAIKDQLWVAVNESRELKGYLMFGGTMPTLKVFQIYACKTSKGHLLGSKMLSELKKFADTHRLTHPLHGQDLRHQGLG